MNLETLFELSLDLMTVAGFDGYFKRLNPMWSKTLGWTHEELLSRPNIDFVHPDDRTATLEARATLTEGEPLYGLVNRYLCKDGSFRWLQWNSVAYKEHQLVYAVARDITRQRSAEVERDRYSRELVVSERLTSIGRLVSGVAHEINNPLAVVVSNLEYARRELPGLVQGDSTELVSAIAEAHQSGMRIHHIVQSLRAFARTGAERRVPLNVRSVMERTPQLVGNQLRKRAQIVEGFSDVPQVVADEASLGEVFRHLLFNAVDFMAHPERTGNEIRVSTWTDDAGAAVVEVQDNGAGMSEPQLERIFDPFFTTQPVGLGVGLGLSICHSVITGLGGTIQVKSAEGKGSTFRVVLPPAPRPLDE